MGTCVGEQGEVETLRALVSEWQNVAQLAAVDGLSGAGSLAPAAVAKELLRARTAATQLQARILNLHGAPHTIHTRW